MLTRNLWWYDFDRLYNREHRIIRGVLEPDFARVAPREGERRILGHREALRSQRRRGVVRGYVLRARDHLARHREPIGHAARCTAPDPATHALARLAKRLLVPVAALDALPLARLALLLLVHTYMYHTVGLPSLPLGHVIGNCGTVLFKS